MKNIQPQSEIILYQPDNEVRLEVRLQDETIWLTQQQIADLFGVKQPAISKHLNNIFRCGELKEESVHSILEYTANDGKKYKTNFYNLDAILSVGYRVNSINATAFRQWANNILKDYLIGRNTLVRRVEHLEQRMSQTEGKVDFFVRSSLPPAYGIYFDGQIFDAYVYVTSLIKTAQRNIVLIDNYVDESVLNHTAE